MAKAGGNPENLKPVRTTEEARKRGANGGRKSGEARRRKRDVKSAAKMILNLPCGEDVKNILADMGVDDEDFTNRVAVLARAYAKALKGDVSAARFLFEMAEETPAQKFARQRYKDEQTKGEETGSVVDDWVNSIPEVTGDDANGNE